MALHRSRAAALRRRASLVALLCFGLGGLAAERVVLRLSGPASFQFAGYYAALDQGLYREAGMDVEIAEGGAGIDPVAEVVGGRADFGVGTSGLVLARAAGMPVTVIAAIFQHSPASIISLRNSGIDSVQDLLGKRIMLGPRSEELLAYLNRAGLKQGSYIVVTYANRLDDLVNGRVDAMSANSSYDAVRLATMKVPFNLYTPRSEGIDFYGDNLFTSDNEARLRRGRVAAFREASLRGWLWALENPAMTAELLVSKNGCVETKEFLLAEASQVKLLVRDDLVELGYMSEGRWEYIAGAFASLGMLESEQVPAGFVWNPTPDFSWGWRVLGIASIWLVAASIIAFVYWRMYRRLKVTVARVKLFETVIEQSPVSVVITDPEAIIQFVNPGFAAVTGYKADEVVGQSTRILSSGKTEKEAIESLWKNLLDGKPWTGEFVNRRKNGELFNEEAHIAPVLDDRGKVTHYVAVKMDITARKEAEAKIAHLAHNDALTDLPNRALFADRFQQALLAAKREQTSLALFYLDLDGFKPVNDSYGHAAGDEVLCEVGRRWQALVRKVDTVARMGGDEFTVLAPGVKTGDEAAFLASKLSDAVLAPIVASGVTVHVGVSVGWAIFPDDGCDMEALFRHADKALYADKATHKGSAR